MSNYSKTTDFEAKDSLPTGDSGKIIRGAEFETEFDAISTAIATKADTAGPTFTGTLTFETISDGTIGVTAFVDEDNMASDSATLVPTQQSVKAYVDSQVTAQDLDFQADSGGALSIDLDSEALTLTGGTGIDTSGSGNTVTFAIDSTVTTLTGTQTLTNKTLTTPTISGNLTTDGTIDGRDVAADGTKLDGIEASATADQTAAEIRTLVESATDSNVFTDADHTKLDGIEASATADQTAAEIRTLVDSATDSNVFTDADHTKLDGIEASADVTDTANVTAAGALMDSEVTNLAQVKAFDSADYATAAQGSTADSAMQDLVDDTTPQLGGDLASNGNDILFADSDKAIFGAGSDLQIYHDGSHSYIEDAAGTGNLKLRTNTLRIENAAGTELSALFVQDGAATLYNDNSAKLATTATGVDVTGTAVTDGLTSDGVATVRVSGAGSTVEAFNVYNTDGGSNNSQVRLYLGASEYNTAGRGLRIDAGRDSGADGIATFYSVDQAEHSDYEAIKILTDGGVTLSHLGSNKIATTSTGIDVTGTAKVSTSMMVGSTDAPARDLEIKTSNPHIRLTDTDGGYTEIFGGSGITTINADKGQNVAGSVLKLSVDATDGLTIDSSHNVSLPNGNLDVTGTVTADGLTVQTTNGLDALLESTGTSYQYLQFKNTAEVQNYLGFVGDDFTVTAGNTKYLQVEGNGDISFYEDTGTTAKLFWDASAESLGIGNTSPTRDLTVGDNAASSYINIKSSAINGISGLAFGDSGDDNRAQIIFDNSTDKLQIQNGGGGALGNRGITLDSSENVGIGTSSPSYSLDVDEVGTNSTGTFLLTGGNSASNDYTQTALLKLRGTSINPNQPAHNANSSVAEIRLNHADLAGSASSGNITFYTNPSNNVNGSLAERMRIDSSGQVGIGTSSPADTLSVVNLGSSGTGVQISSGTATGDLRFKARTESYNGILSVYDSGSNEDVRISAHSGVDTYFNSGSNVGIGTDSPAAPLEVAGSINSALFNLTGAGTNFELRATSGSGAVANTSLYRLALDYLNGSFTNGFIDFYRGSAGNDGYLAFGSSGTEACASTLVAT